MSTNLVALQTVEGEIAAALTQVAADITAETTATNNAVTEINQLLANATEDTTVGQIATQLQGLLTQIQTAGTNINASTSALTAAIPPPPTPPAS